SPDSRFRNRKFLPQIHFDVDFANSALCFDDCTWLCPPKLRLPSVNIRLDQLAALVRLPGGAEVIKNQFGAVVAREVKHCRVTILAVRRVRLSVAPRAVSGHT